MMCGIVLKVHSSAAETTLGGGGGGGRRKSDRRGCLKRLERALAEREITGF